MDREIRAVDGGTTDGRGPRNIIGEKDNSSKVEYDHSRTGEQILDEACFQYFCKGRRKRFGAAASCIKLLVAIHNTRLISQPEDSAYEQNCDKWVMLECLVGEVPGDVPLGHA